MTVIYVRDSKSKGYLRIGVDDNGEKVDLTVSASEYRDAGEPKTRDNLTRDSFEILSRADMRYRARLYALRILSYGDNSELMLKRKLRAKGISADKIDEVVREMVSRGYINSTRQIEKLVQNEVELHFSGPLKIVPKLIAKGYSKSEILKVIDDLSERGEIDFDKAKQRLIKSKLPSDANGEEIKKLLYKHGYYIC